MLSCIVPLLPSLIAPCQVTADVICQPAVVVIYTLYGLTVQMNGTDVQVTCMGVWMDSIDICIINASKSCKCWAAACRVHINPANTTEASKVFKSAMDRFSDCGGAISDSSAEASKGAAVVVIMVTNSDQADNALFGTNGAISGVPDGSVIVLCSTVYAKACFRSLDWGALVTGGCPNTTTCELCLKICVKLLGETTLGLGLKEDHVGIHPVSPKLVHGIHPRVSKIIFIDEKRNISLVDAPVSGGFARAANGTLTIMASGTTEALEEARPVLSAMSEKLFIVEGGVGAGSGALYNVMAIGY
eukprot:Gb_23160 [translate_table: standard]